MKHLVISAVLLVSIVSKGADAFVFDTISDLLSWPGSSRQPNFEVKGYNSVGDWGTTRAGKYITNSVAATNLGCVFMPTNGVGRFVFEDCESGEVDVRWFGASGTNATANVAAIQAAVDYAESLTPNSAVLIDGDFTLNASITVRSATIRGRHFLDLNAVNQSSTLRMEHANTNDVLLLSSTNNLKPRVENLRIFATGESGARGKVAILSVSSRTNFVVATNHVPASTATVSEWPYYGHCFFYSAEGRYIGSGVVLTNDATTGDIVLEPSSDKYAVPTGETALTTNCTVAFSPVVTEVATYLGGSSTNTMADPTRVGPVGIRVASKGYAVIENVDVLYGHCAVAVGYLNTGLQLRNFSASGFKFAGVAGLRRAQNSDSWSSRVRLNGTYLADTTWPAAEALTFDDSCFRRAHAAIWLPGYTSSWDDLLAYSLVHGVVLDRAYHVTGGAWLLDDVTHDGIVYYSGPSDTNYLQSALVVNSCIVRPSFLTSEPTAYTLNNAGVRVFGNGYAKLDFGGLYIEGVTYGVRTNKFDYGVDVQSFNQQWVSAAQSAFTGAAEQYNTARDRLWSQASVLRGASGIAAASGVRAEIDQGGTAGYAGQLISINEQNVGSGVGRYNQFLLGGTNRYIHQVSGDIQHVVPNSGSTRFEYWKSDGATNSEVRIGWGAPSVNSRLELRGNEIRSAVASTAATNTLIFQSAGGVSDFYGPVVLRGTVTTPSGSSFINDGSYPTNNGAYVLFVTNGVASWIAHP